MKPLILMYVFYDKNGDIKAITPTLDEHFSNSFSVATFPLSDVEGFLRAERNSFDYQVQQINTIAGKTFKIVKKVSKITTTKTLDNYLTLIENEGKHNNTLVVTNIVPEKTVFIELSEVFRSLAFSADEDEQELVNNFLNRGNTAIYLTEKNNPYRLLFSCIFSPKQLFEVGKLYFKYEGHYTNTSAYTKKIIEGYGFKERLE